MFITVITIVMDMDVTITLHGTHLPIWMKNVSDALSKTWVICVGNESRMEEGFSVSDGSSMSRASLTFIDVGWDLFCLGFSVIFRDFVMISHKLAKASKLGGRLVSSSDSSVSPLPSLLIKPAVFSRLSIS